MSSQFSFSRYFGDKNSNPVLDLLAQAGANAEILDYVNYTMATYVRMPYSNNWRVNTLRSERSLVANCPGCTVGSNSGRNAMQIADILGAEGVQIFGWDLEWNMNFNTDRLKYGGLQMFMRLGSGANSKQRGKTVVLAHDRAFG